MDELIDVVDENDRELGFTKLKSEAHRDWDWHRGAHVWIVCDKQIMMEKRAPKKFIFPGRFDVACAGHVASGEGFKQTAIRELEEELGIKAKESDLILLGKQKAATDTPGGARSREIIEVFLLRFNGNMGELRLCKEEISEVKLFGISELRKLIETRPKMFSEHKEYFLDTIGKIEKLL